MKKIVISANTTWNIYNFRLNLIRALKDKGYRIIIISPFDEYVEQIKKEFKYYDIYMNQKGTNPKEDLKTMISYYKILKQEKPDFMLNFTIKPNIYGSIAANFLNIKTINNISGLGTLFIKTTFSTQVAKFLYKIALKKSYKVFFQNKDDYNLFIKNNLVNRNIADILPGSGVDTEKFKAIQYDKKDKKFRFLLIARMIKDKGIEEYIQAAKIIKKEYKNVECYLLGAVGVNNITAISIEKIKEWEKEKIISYLGVKDDIRSEISKVDCIVLPSYREGMSRVLLESAAMEKPIITTDVPGCKEVVNDGINGFLCEVKNSEDLANKMKKILYLDDKNIKKMGEEGRKKIIKEFDEKIVINKYIEIL